LNYSDSLEFNAAYSVIEDALVKSTPTSVGVTSNNGYLSLWGADETFDLYEILQFHFHSPAEHTIDGKLYDAELHIVHSNS
jgi:carbonic anhydrase